MSEIIEKVKSLCVCANARLIALLETSRAGEEVDNGMGVDFDLSRYAVIYKYLTKREALDDMLKIDNVFRDTVSAQLFDVERVESLDGMINELKETDSYELLWRDESYKDPERIKSELQCRNSLVTLAVSRGYSLYVSYAEISKYQQQRTTKNYQSDLFKHMLDENPAFAKLKDEYRFTGDQTRIREVLYDTDGVHFIFTCDTECNVGSGSSRLYYHGKADDVSMVLQDFGFIRQLQDILEKKIEEKKNEKQKDKQ